MSYIAIKQKEPEFKLLNKFNAYVIKVIINHYTFLPLTCYMY